VHSGGRGALGGSEREAVAGSRADDGNGYGNGTGNGDDNGDGDGDGNGNGNDKPERHITVIRSLKLVRKGDVDAKGIAEKIVMAKKGKIV